VSWQARALSLLLRATARPYTRLRSEEDIASFRSLAARLDARLGRAPRGVAVRWDESGPVPGQWIEPPGARPDRLLLYLHGGGFVARTPVLHAGLVARLCAASSMRAFVPDYRLAPEHPHPAAPQDCIDAYAWLASKPASGRIAVAGDSAGGCLVLTTLLQARDLGLARSPCGVLFSPATDLARPGESYRTNARRDALASDWESIQVLARAYLGDVDPTDPLASPIYAELEGLPPFLCQVSDTELLLDDARGIVAGALAAGVDAQLDVYEGTPHVFQAFEFLPESREAVARVVLFMNKHLEDSS